MRDNIIWATIKCVNTVRMHKISDTEHFDIRILLFMAESIGFDYSNNVLLFSS